MPAHVAFLRAINVSGRFIQMATLARYFHTLGHADARTYINSGNVIFTSKTRSPGRLESSIETGLAPMLGFSSEVFLRTATQVDAIAGTAKALRERVPASGEVNVAFLREPLTPAQVDQLALLRSTLDDFVVDGAQIYWLCLGRQSDSRFSNATLERRLRLRTTLRRVSMLQGLAAALRA